MGLLSKSLSIVAHRGRLGRGTLLIGLLVCLVSQSGCQAPSGVVSRRLIEHRAMVDFRGLAALQTFPEVKAQAAVPETWQQMRTKRGAIFTDVHWKSPSGQTGVGVAHVRLPLPLSSKMILWLAKKEYAKRYPDGELLSQWTDSAGREWFEAENAKYHVRGCAIVNGWEAWIIYFGYKRDRIPNANELSLAARSVETIVPTPLAEAAKDETLSASAE